MPVKGPSFHYFFTINNLCSTHETTFVLNMRIVSLLKLIQLFHSYIRRKKKGCPTVRLITLPGSKLVVVAPVEMYEVFA